MTKETRAEIPVNPTFSFLPQGTEGALSIGSILALIIGAIFKFRRKKSRDGTEIIKDRTEGKLFTDMMVDREAIMKDRDSARTSEREAWTRANEVSVENARLTEQNKHQAMEIARLVKAMEELQHQFDEIKVRLQSLSRGATGHTGFDILDQ